MTIKWECPGCDALRIVAYGQAVIVKSPGCVGLVTTCPDCGCVHVEDALDVVALARLCVSTVTLTDRDLAAGAQRDGVISENEVLMFTKRLERSPDGRDDAPWHAGRYVALSALWAELAGVQS